MKFLFIKQQVLDKVVEVAKHDVSEFTSFDEVVFNEQIYKRISKVEYRNIFKNMKSKYDIFKYDRILRKRLSYILEEEKEIFVIFAKDVGSQTQILDYLKILLIDVKLKIYQYSGEKKYNLLKYINEYSEKKQVLPHNLKALFICDNLKKLDFNILEQVIKECKTVNIYTTSVPEKHIEKKINKINEKEGTTIEIISGLRKSFNEFDISIFYDISKNDLPRLRLKDDSLIIDCTDVDSDKYDNNIINVENKLKKELLNKEELEMLYRDYGKCNVASIIEYIWCLLDKRLNII